MEKKTYLILGASSDLGTALIRKLFQTGRIETLQIAAHYYSNCEELKTIMKQNPQADIRLFQADMGDADSVGNFIKELKENYIAPAFVVDFCASKYSYNRLSEWDSGRVQKEMFIQVYSFVEIIRSFITDMVKNNYGKIVVMLSAATIGIPPKNTTEYTAVKYALLGLIKSIAAEYGSSGININAVSPGMIETKFINGIGRKIREYTAESSPRHRNLTVEDVIPTIMLLLSDESQYMNGTNINLSGQPD